MHYTVEFQIIWESRGATILLGYKVDDVNHEVSIIFTVFILDLLENFVSEIITH